MPTTINIQHTMSHGLLPVFILFILVISPFIVKLMKKRGEKTAAKNESVNQAVPLTVKEEYVGRLTSVSKDFGEGRIDSKEGYKSLSIILREFILEYAGVDVTKKTLAEIKRSNIPSVAKLIEEYYVAEFSPDKEGDLEASLTKTKRLINNWREPENK